MPRIPTGRLGTRYELTAGAVSGDVEYYHTFTQDNFASYETRTSGYDMLNVMVEAITIWQQQEPRFLSAYSDHFSNNLGLTMRHQFMDRAFACNFSKFLLIWLS